jgi:hypothetical protein
MHGKFHNVPDSFDRPNVTGAYVIYYLINGLSHSDGGTIVTLVDILVNVLDSLDRGADLDIHVAVIPGRQGGIIGHNMAVVKYMTSGIGIGSAIVWPGIFWIAILAKTCFSTKESACCTCHQPCKVLCNLPHCKDHASCTL